MGKKILLLLFFTQVAFANQSSINLNTQIDRYQSCLQRVDAKTCTQRWYQPILEYCKSGRGECLPDIQSGDPGALSFMRCPQADSCVIEDGIFTALLRKDEQRAEVRDPFESAYGELMEYRFTLRIPSGPPLDNDHGTIVVAQLHADNDFSPTFALRFKENEDLVVTLRHLHENPEDLENGKEVVLFRKPMQRDRWYNFVFQVRTGKNGTLHMWLDGESKIKYEGPVGYQNKISYFKFGLYDYTSSLKNDFKIQVKDYHRTTFE